MAVAQENGFVRGPIAAEFEWGSSFLHPASIGLSAGSKLKYRLWLRMVDLALGRVCQVMILAGNKFANRCQADCVNAEDRPLTVSPINPDRIATVGVLHKIRSLGRCAAHIFRYGALNVREPLASAGTMPETLHVVHVKSFRWRGTAYCANASFDVRAFASVTYFRARPSTVISC